VHYEFLSAKVDPDHWREEGTFRDDDECCALIGKKEKMWLYNQPRQFRMWLNAEMEGVFRDFLPRMYEKQFRLALGGQRGMSAADITRAARFLAERFDPDFKPKTESSVKMKPLEDVMKGLEAKAAAYKLPSFGEGDDVGAQEAHDGGDVEDEEVGDDEGVEDGEVEGREEGKEEADEGDVEEEDAVEEEETPAEPVLGHFRVSDDKESMTA